MSLVTALLVIILPLPAKAHAAHGAEALATRASAGPFIVTVWAIEGEVDGTLEIQVVSEGDLTPQTIDVVGGESQVTRLQPADADETWTGIVRRPSTETESLEIRLVDDTGRRGVLAVSVPNLVIPGMSLIVLVLMAQAVITLAWLLLRWPRVWGRSSWRGGADAPQSELVEVH